MTTVSRVSQVSHTNATGGGDWDHRLNRLLEDLQETVPPESKHGTTNEYREFRMTQRTQINDQPAQQIEEKWVEVGSTGGGAGSISASSRFGGEPGATGTKSVAFSDDLSRRFDTVVNRPLTMEYLAPANSTTVLKSGPSSPHSPNIEKKEFYSKASYTTLIKGGPELVPVNFEVDSSFPQEFRESSRTATTSSTKRYEMEKQEQQQQQLGSPLYTSTPKPPRGISHQQQEYRSDLITDRTRSVTPPPRSTEPLKTPPMIRKILQSTGSQGASSCYHSSSLSSTNKVTTTTKTTTNNNAGGGGAPPVGGVKLLPSYEEAPLPPPAKYYTSTSTTREYHKGGSEREVSPVRRFPSPNQGPPKGEEEPPKRLEQLLATFGDHSYSESTTTRYDGSGAHKSIPYGPGTAPVQPLRSVRIDDNLLKREEEEEAERLIQRKVGGGGGGGALVPSTTNRVGPPVYFPPGQIFQKTEAEALSTVEGKGKMKAKREYKAKEKMKSKHSEKDGGGALPVPVCLPVCCAAPCVIM